MVDIGGQLSPDMDAEIQKKKRSVMCIPGESEDTVGVGDKYIVPGDVC